MPPRQDISITLLYPPNQTLPGYMCKPNGSLAYPYLAASLLAEGFGVKIFDACVGNEKDDLDEVFYRPSELANGLYRTGVSDSRILEEVADADAVGLTSIFTAQERMVLDTASLIRRHFPEKLLIAGGVNARNRLKRFFQAGFDIVCLSEAERTIVRIMQHLASGNRDVSDIPGIAICTEDRLVLKKMQREDIAENLDDLPFPAWQLLPNDRYWRIARPHGGHFDDSSPLRYASLLTSRGCVFSCSFCHIGGETATSVAENIGRFRVKSDERVLEEIEKLKTLGATHIFLEDDTFFGMKRRALRLLAGMRDSAVEILDVNGVNAIHLFRPERGRFVPDLEVLEAMKGAGFREIVVAFESASKRVIDKYISGKWNPENCDVAALLAAANHLGLFITGNYMIGFPDETQSEVLATIDLARQHRDWGLNATNIYCVIPLPGTPLFDLAVRNGNLDPDFDPDMMNWTIANMKNTPVSKEELEELRQSAWLELNDPATLESRLAMTPVR